MFAAIAARRLVRERAWPVLLLVALLAPWLAPYAPDAYTDDVLGRLFDALATREGQAPWIVVTADGEQPVEPPAIACPLCLPDYGPPPATDRLVDLGAHLYLQKGCITCHGPEGRGLVKNPGSFKGYIPAWDSADYAELVRDDDEFREATRGRDVSVYAEYMRNQVRELLNKHRDSTTCKSCHQKIDPPGDGPRAQGEPRLPVRGRAARRDPAVRVQALRFLRTRGAGDLRRGM